MSRFWALLCFLAIGLVPSIEVAAKGRLFFDAYRQTSWLLSDTGLLGLSSLRKIIIDSGLRPIRFKAPLDRVIPELDRGDILFLSVVKYGKYSSSELKAVKSFVRRGGRVLVIGEHENMYQSSSVMQNPLVSNFGFRFNHDSIIVGDSSWIKVGSDVLNCRGAIFYCSPTIQVIGPKARIISNRHPVIGVYRSQGRVMVVGDSEFYHNGQGRRFGMGHGNNAAMSKAIIKWLAAGPIRDSSVRYQPRNFFVSTQKAANATVLHVYLGGYGGFPDHELDGYALFLEELERFGFQVRLQWNLKAIPRKAKVIFLHTLRGRVPSLAGRFDKIVVIGDSYTVIDSYTDNGRTLFQMGLRPLKRPFFARLLKQRGIEFPPGTLMNLQAFWDEETNFGVESREGYFIGVKRPGLVLPRSSTPSPLIAKAPVFYNPVNFGLDERVPWKKRMQKKYYDLKDVRPENVGMVQYLENLKLPTRPQSDVPPGPYALVHRRGKTLVVADGDMLTNEYLDYYPDNCKAVTWIRDFLVGQSLEKQPGRHP